MKSGTYVTLMSNSGGPAATARAGLQPGNFPALHRTVRGDGRLVANEPATEADEDRCPRGASRPRHHLPVGRGCGNRPDGAIHPRRNPPIAGTAVMRVKLELPANERARLGRSVWRAEKRRRWARVMRVRDQIGLHSDVQAHASAARATKHLIRQQIQATLPSSGSPIGECRFGSLRPKPVR